MFDIDKNSISPFLCASAITLKQNVVLPEDQDHSFDVTLPLGKPPAPSERSIASEPVEITDTFIFVASPNSLGHHHQIFY